MRSDRPLLQAEGTQMRGESRVLIGLGRHREKRPRAGYMYSIGSTYSSGK